MKKILVLFCALLSLMCCSCKWLFEEEYICDVAEVESIEIVRYDGVIENEYRPKYTVLADVSDHEKFVRRLKAIDCSGIGGPQVLCEGEITARIEFKNGDYDLLQPALQWIRRDGENKDGHLAFDKEQFQTLIAVYWNEDSKEDLNKFSLEEYQREMELFSSDKTVGEVKSFDLAVEKSKELWREKYGEEAKFEKNERTVVEYDSEQDCWHIQNMPPKDQSGGVYHTIIKVDGTVIAVWVED